MSEYWRHVRIRGGCILASEQTGKAVAAHQPDCFQTSSSSWRSAPRNCERVHQAPFLLRAQGSARSRRVADSQWRWRRKGARALPIRRTVCRARQSRPRATRANRLDMARASGRRASVAGRTLDHGSTPCRSSLCTGSLLRLGDLEGCCVGEKTVKNEELKSQAPHRSAWHSGTASLQLAPLSHLFGIILMIINSREKRRGGWRFLLFVVCL